MMGSKKKKNLGGKSRLSIKNGGSVISLSNYSESVSGEPRLTRAELTTKYMEENMRPISDTDSMKERKNWTEERKATEAKIVEERERIEHETAAAQLKKKRKKA